MTNNYTPSAELVRAAELLFLAIAAEQLVAEPVLAYKKAILEREVFVVEEGLPGAGKRILDPAETWLMPFKKMQLFVDLCEPERIRANLPVEKPGNCPLLEAKEARRVAERHLLETAIKELPVAGLDKVLTGPLEFRDRAVDLVSKLVAPFVREAPQILSLVR